MFQIGEKLPEVVWVEAREHHTLALRFEDGTEGVIALSQVVPFEGIFEELRQPEAFAQVYVEHTLGTIAWPNGADLDPLVLYELVRASQRAA